MNKFTEKRTFSFTPIYWILGVIILISLTLNGFQFRRTFGLKEKQKEISIEKEKLSKENKNLKEANKKDSLSNVFLLKDNLKKDSIIEFYIRSEKYYKNAAFKNHKKYLQAKEAFNNSNDSDRDSIAAAIAKQ